MASFLSEGSKFLFFDTSICRNTVWFPSGTDSLPRVAEECTLGTTGYYSVAGGIIFFLCLILVCLKAPEKRELKSHYGTDFDHGESDLESAHEYGYSEGSYGEEGESAGMYDMHDVSDALDMQDVPYSPNRYGEPGEFNESMSQTSGPMKGGESSSTLMNNEDLVSQRLKTLDPAEDRYTAKPKDDEEDEVDDRYKPTKPEAAPPATNQTVSESRLHTIERMKLNTNVESEDMIEKFVNELNVSFQVETEEEKKKKEKEKEELTVETNVFCQPTLCTPSTARSF